MRKTKTYEISVIDKTYSKTISDETKFYTSDTALELVFKLKETEYTFESAEIVILNIDDRSLTTRPVSKVNNDFVYELDDDIVPHYGEWHGQLRFEAGETYVSSPVKFRIENDLSNDRPPQLSDVQSWVKLKRYADSLVGELKQAVLEVEGMDDTFNANELERQTTFEMAESERDRMFESNEATRQSQELEREGVEATRQQAELFRVENETQRNLTSVEEFIKLQDSIGGRNMVESKIPLFVQNLVGSGSPQRMSDETGDFIRLTPTQENSVNTYMPTSNLKFYQSRDVDKSYVWSIDVRIPKTNYVSMGRNKARQLISDENEWVRLSTTEIETVNSFNFFGLTYSEVGEYIDYRNLKLEQGMTTTPYTKAPEEYTSVSKDDYYNHIKMMSEHRDNQLLEIKTAITALGGA